jgi:hypothetical protein
MTKNKRFSPASEKGHLDGLVDEGEYLRQSSLYKQILPRPVRRSFSEGGTTSRQTRSLPTYQVGPRNLCNLCLINDLRLRILTYEIINFFCKTNPISKKVK